MSERRVQFLGATSWTTAGRPEVHPPVRLAISDAELELVGTGHSGGDEMTDRLVAATDRFANRA